MFESETQVRLLYGTLCLVTRACEKGLNPRADSPVLVVRISALGLPHKELWGPPTNLKAGPLKSPRGKTGDLNTHFLGISSS